MGCGTSKDIQPLPPQSRVQTALSKETKVQQPQDSTEQAVSTSTDDDKSDQLASKVATESEKPFIISADSSARQIGKPTDSQVPGQATHSIGKGPDMSVVAVLEPTGGVQPRPASSTCQNESASQSKTISDNDDSRGPELYTEKIGAEAARHKEEVQPFQECGAAVPAVAGDKSGGSPWAYLQKTYSNMDEAGHCADDTKGQDDCPQGDRPSFADLHTADGAAMPVQAGRVLIQSQASGPDVWSRNVPENAWGEASAVCGPAALPDAAHQRPQKELSVIASVQAQTVVDDLGMEDVDEFEAELAALNNANTA